MSVKSGTKKISQDELRRIMSEQKKKLLQTVRKIDSPLAKYKNDGTLMCILCNTVVRSEAVWNVHINAKQHKENITKKKEQQQQELLYKSQAEVVNSINKRPPSTVAETPQPPKKLKSILKNAPQPRLPDGFFDSQNKTSIVAQTAVSNETEPMEEEETEKDVESEEEKDASQPEVKDNPLPEGFFDDPVMDAKARNVEYKDPIQEEWERFQKEMKEETSVSAQIIEDDQEEATAERQIQEIDEQMRNWSRVLDLELKKEKVKAEAVKSASESMQDALTEDDEEEEDFDEFLDWRAKKSFK